MRDDRDLSPDRARFPRAYLLQEAACILGLSYLVLMGGTLNGLLRFRLHVASHILIALILLAWLVTVIRSGRRVPRTGLEWGLLAFLGVGAVTTALSSDPRRSLGWLGLMVLYALWLYLVLDLLRRGWPAELLIKALLIVGGIVIVFGLVEVGVWWAEALRRPSAGRLALSTFRLYSVLGDANMASSFLNLLLPLGLVRLLAARDGLTRMALVLWCTANLIVQFFTSSRGGWLGTAAALITLAGLIWLANPDDWRGRLVAWGGRWWARPWVRAVLGATGLAVLVAVVYVAQRQLRHPSHGDLWESRRDFWRSAWLAFLSSPWHGVGPFTYGTEFFKYTSAPPWRPYPHAHSVPLTVLAEGGVLGIVSGLALFAAAVRALWPAWRSAGTSQRWLRCGAMAGLVGFAVHSLMDNHTLVPAIAMTGIAILALALSTGRGAPDPTATRDAPVPPSPAARRLRPMWLVAPAIALIVAGFWSDWAYAPFVSGVDAAKAEQWRTAAELMEVAARRDSRLAFYHLQCGYAWGRVAAGGINDGALDAAIHAYERGVALEPDYSANHANLAALYWQAGRRNEAVAEMGRAHSLAPGGSINSLNLARYYEDLGQADQATQAYVDLLNSRPDLAGAGHYWKRTPVRWQAFERWTAASPAPPLPARPVTADDFLAVGRDAYARHDWATAGAAFARAQALAPASLDAFLGLGQSLLAAGKLDDAERVLRQGLEAFTMDEGKKLDLLLAYARLAHEQGRTEEAVRRAELALTMIEKPTVFGRGTLGWSPYGWFLFQRESIEPDLLPQLARLEVTDVLADRYLELGRWYEDLGRSQDAAEAYRRILAVIPDFQPALQGLSRVTSAGQQTTRGRAVF